VLVLEFLYFRLIILLDFPAMCELLTINTRRYFISKKMTYQVKSRDVNINQIKCVVNKDQC